MSKKVKKISVGSWSAVILSIFFLGFIFFSRPNIQAVDCNTLSGDQKKECRDLEEQQKIYQDLLEKNKKQQATLSDTLLLMKMENSKLEKEIGKKKNEIESLSGQIERMTNQIAEYEKSVALQQEALREILQNYYEERKAETFSFFMASNEVSSLIRGSDQMASAEEKLSGMIANISDLKNKLGVERKSVEEKKNELQGYHEELREKNENLEADKQDSEMLMQRTKGEEAKYQALLDNIEKQKQDLLNIDELSLASGLSSSDYEKPKSGLASTNWYYSQKDSRWGNDTIGRSNSKMKDWGCAVTSVAMVFNYHGGSITPKKLSDTSQYFSWDLIKWPTSWSSPKLVLTSGISHGNINWKIIDSSLANGNPVIVYIKKTNGGGGHYVVIHHKNSDGRYVVHDPYFGSNIYLDTSRALVGKIGSDSKTIIDQMIIYKKN